MHMPTCLHLVCGFGVGSVLCVFSSLGIISPRKRELVVVLFSVFQCIDLLCVMGLSVISDSGCMFLLAGWADLGRTA